MKIGVNAQFLQFPATGSGQYLVHLLNSLSTIDQRNEYTLLGASPISIQAPGSYPYHVYPVPSLLARNKNSEKVAWEQWICPSAARNEHLDLLHVPYFAPPLIERTPTIVTIHDVIPLRLPAYQASARVKAYLQLIARAAHHTDMIITVSQHAKQDMIDALKLPDEKIRVIYEAASDDYKPVTDAERLAQVRSRYGLGERYIFYLGGLDQRKNIPQLIHAFARLQVKVDDPELKLLIAGNPDKQKGPLFPDPRPVAADLGMTGKIIYRFVEEEDKPALYSGASLFVFPSLYEGFGLDPLEAMSCGAPVVCSNRTSLPEVVGDAALSVDPDDIEALVSAMHTVLTDPARRRELCARSLQQSQRFSWRKTAEETLAVYEEVFASTKKHFQKQYLSLK